MLDFGKVEDVILERKRVGAAGRHLNREGFQVQEFTDAPIPPVGIGQNVVSRHQIEDPLSAQPGTQVSVSYRKDRFTRIKPKNRERVSAALAEGVLDVRWSTSVTRIEPERVWLSTADERSEAMENDQLFIFAGGELPTAFLRDCGVQIDTKFGTP